MRIYVKGNEIDIEQGKIGSIPDEIISDVMLPEIEN